MNKKKIIIITSIVIVAITTLIIFLTKDFIFYPQTDAQRFKKEYEDLNTKIAEYSLKYPKVTISDDNIIKYSTIEEMLNILNNGEDGVIYYGYPTCLYCRNAIQILLDTAEESKLDVIHYVDIEKYWKVLELNANNKPVTKKEADASYNKLLNTLGEKFTEEYILKDELDEDVNTGEKRLNVPLVIFVTNGEISSYNIGTLFSHQDPLYEMNDEQKEALKEIYNSGIEDVVDSKINKGLIK